MRLANRQPHRIFPCALRPAPCALRPAPCALRPAPCALRPAPCALRPAPCALRPAPCALRPASPSCRSTRLWAASVRSTDPPATQITATCAVLPFSTLLRRPACAISLAPRNDRDRNGRAMKAVPPVAWRILRGAAHGSVPPTKARRAAARRRRHRPLSERSSRTSRRGHTCGPSIPARPLKRRPCRQGLRSSER